MISPILAGRAEVLRELHARLKQANQNQGTTLFLAGEAGIGKSRLVHCQYQVKLR